MSTITQQVLIAMEKPGELKKFTIIELWTVYSSLEESKSMSPEMQDRLMENIFVLVKEQFNKYKDANSTRVFAEAFSLISNFPYHLTTTPVQNACMDTVESSLFEFAFELASTTEQFMELLSLAKEGKQSDVFCALCKEKAISVATTTKDRHNLEKAEILEKV